MDTDSFNKNGKICSIILSIPNTYLDSLSSEDLLCITNGLFRNISFCGCISGKQENTTHKCTKFYPREIHNPACKCCQTYEFTYFLGRLLERLALEGKLEVFKKTDLRAAKIRDRIYNFKRNGSKFEFEIVRHPKAFTDPANMIRMTQHLTFDFSDLSLKQLPENLVYFENMIDC